MKTNEFDLIIAGAGIVGLAAAYQAQKKHPLWKILILEKESEPALHQTGHNSGVVHTGVYYKPGSLKAKNCIEGRKELLAFCDEQSVQYQQKHKLIIATHPKELPSLWEIYKRGEANGVSGLQILGRQEVIEIEPHVNALQALFIPECHIVDYRKVAKALLKEIHKAGADTIFNQPVMKVVQENAFCTVIGQTATFQTRLFLNCAGLYSDRLAQGSQKHLTYQIIPFRGEYYELTPQAEKFVKGLIYPVPDARFPFLGVHLTPMVGGKVEAGPNAVLSLAREGYRKDDYNWQDMKDLIKFPGFWKMAVRYWKAGAYELARSLNKKMFLRDLQRLVPAIQKEDLLPGSAGIRAQAVARNGKLMDDFALLQEGRCLHVLNAPSPAATASFSIGRTLLQMIDGALK